MYYSFFKIEVRGGIGVPVCVRARARVEDGQVWPTFPNFSRNRHVTKYHRLPAPQHPCPLLIWPVTWHSVLLEMRLKSCLMACGHLIDYHPALHAGAAWVPGNVDHVYWIHGHLTPPLPSNPVSRTFTLRFQDTNPLLAHHPPLVEAKPLFFIFKA